MALVSHLHKATSFLTPLFFGFIGVLAFAPFSIKFLIILSYSYLIHLIFFSSDNAIFKKLISWVIGHWGIGVSWVIVSVYYYGNVGYIASAIVYLLFLSLIFLFAVAPIKLFKLHETNNSRSHLVLYISSVLLLMELSRDFFFGGFPWLIPGTVSIDTILVNIMPLLGIAGASFIIYFLATLIASCWGTARKISYFVLTLSVVLLLPFESDFEIKDNNLLSISVVQPSLDPKLKTREIYKPLIEETLIKLTNSIEIDSELIVWPEVELPYAFNSRNYKNLKQKITKQAELITGIWVFDENELFNALVNIETDEIYKKQHLVPFGEYIPFKSILNPILSYFGAPISDISSGANNQSPISVLENIKAAPLICYDIVFGNDVRKSVKSSDFIINISNDSWFGRSLGPYQHLEISRIRAIENNRWLIRATNDGFSAIISNNGTLVGILDKGEQGVLNHTIKLNNINTIYSRYGYFVPYLFCIIYIFISLGAFIWTQRRV